MAVQEFSSTKEALEAAIGTLEKVDSKSNYSIDPWHATEEETLVYRLNAALAADRSEEIKTAAKDLCEALKSMGYGKTSTTSLPGEYDTLAILVGAA